MGAIVDKQFEPKRVRFTRDVFQGFCRQAGAGDLATLVAVESPRPDCCKVVLDAPQYGDVLYVFPETIEDLPVVPDPGLFSVTRPAGHASVLRKWVEQLPLRHQGVLLTAVRGCDTVPKDAAVKHLVRVYRATILYAHDPKPSSFFTFVDYKDAASRAYLQDLMRKVLSDHDDLPHHYLMHLVHAAEVVGYRHPDADVRAVWGDFYRGMVGKFHLNPETQQQLDDRLTADEGTFKENQ